MSARPLSERVSDMIPRYEKLFAERGGITPADPLKFHLYHLARYWSRLVGFCRQDPSKPAGFIDGDLGACVQVGFGVCPQDYLDRFPDLWTMAGLLGADTGYFTSATSQH